MLAIQGCKKAAYRHLWQSSCPLMQIPLSRAICAGQLAQQRCRAFSAPATPSSSPSSSSSSASPLAAVRGMHDILPSELKLRQRISAIFQEVTTNCGFQPIETPIVECSAVFARSLGDTSDVVMKEMYSFAPPRHNLEAGAGADPESLLTLRPEGTAGVIRAILSNKLHFSLPQKLSYQGPMFRAERPQKGRYRQFSQLGVEHIGSSSAAADAECVALAFRFLCRVVDAESLGLQVHINSLGDRESMAAYGKRLQDYFHSLPSDSLSPDSRLRRDRGAYLRILDSKHAADAAVVEAAPGIEESLTSEARERYEEVQELLQGLGIPLVQDSRLVRGLDYYSHTIFEVKAGSSASVSTSSKGSGVTSSSDSGGSKGSSKKGGEKGGAGAAAAAATTAGAGQLGTLLAGGRYENLAGVLGGPESLPCIGWAAGMERLALLSHLRDRQDVLARPFTVSVVPVLPSSKQQQQQVQQSGEAGPSAPSTAPAALAAAAQQNDHHKLARSIQKHAVLAAEELRSAGIRTVLHPAARNLKKGLSAATADSEAVVLVGDGELAAGQLTVKDLASRSQQSLAWQPTAMIPRIGEAAATALQENRSAFVESVLQLRAAFESTTKK